MSTDLSTTHSSQPNDCAKSWNRAQTFRSTLNSLPIIPADVGCIQALSPWRSLVPEDPTPIHDHQPTRSKQMALRQQEFRMGRRIARQALYQVGFRSPTPNRSEIKGDANDSALLIPRNPDRSPRWPDGFVGSISHSPRWVIAAAARSANYRSLGIDTEIIMAKPDAIELKDSIGCPSEWQHLNAINISLHQAVTLLFSAKESYFKCWYPLTRQFWDFRDVRLVGASARSNSLVGSNRSTTGTLILDTVHAQQKSKSDIPFPLPVHFQIHSPDVITFCSLPQL